MTWTMVIGFLTMQLIVIGAIILVLKHVFITSTESAKNRLNQEADLARAKQAELNSKIKEADEELTKRKAEAQQLSQKMLSEAEQLAKTERESLIQKARLEGETIITKAQETRNKIRQELEKEMNIKSVDFAVQIISNILNEEAQSLLSDFYIKEFITGLQKVDMSRIAADAATADVITAGPINEGQQDQILKALTARLNRPVKINFTVDNTIIGGILLKFGSLALDGSIKNLIRDAAVKNKQKIENAG